MQSVLSETLLEAVADAEFAAGERRLWNPTDEMLVALVEASKEIGNAIKSGRNKYDNYDYGTLEDYLDACRRPLLDHGMLLISRPVCDPIFSEAATKSDGVQQVARVLVETRVIHAASKGWIAARCWGEGRDRSDKAIYKALTGGRKYSLAMVLGIYTTDEPEKDSLPAAPQKPLVARGKAPQAPKAPPSAPLPPAESARSWSDEAQQRLIEKLEVLDATEEESHFTRLEKFTTYILGKRAAGMTRDQFEAACSTLVKRADVFRVEGLLTPDDCAAVMAKLASAYAPTTTAAQMPGAPTYEEEQNQ